jgi:hypothetical protein
VFCVESMVYSRFSCSFWCGRFVNGVLDVVSSCCSAVWAQDVENFFFSGAQGS